MHRLSMRSFFTLFENNIWLSSHNYTKLHNKSNLRVTAKLNFKYHICRKFSTSQILSDFFSHFPIQFVWHQSYNVRPERTKVRLQLLLHAHRLALLLTVYVTQKHPFIQHIFSGRYFWGSRFASIFDTLLLNIYIDPLVSNPFKFTTSFTA